jgi:hypothetical protein
LEAGATIDGATKDLVGSAHPTLIDGGRGGPPYRKQKTENGKQKTENGKQKTENRQFKADR